MSSTTRSPVPQTDHALPELAQLLLSTPSVEDFLSDLAVVAARTVTEGGACGITLRRDREPMTVASSDALAVSVDELQYGRGDGPCLESLRTGEIIMVSDLVDEHRWDGYPGHALAHGVRSSLSLPLRGEDEIIGALNLYGRTPNEFDGEEKAARASALAAQASAVLRVVLQQARQAELSEQLRAALVSRSTIDQALGILMGQQRCSATEAFGLLRSASQHRNRKLRDIAADVITSATGRPPEVPRSFDERA